MSKQSIVVLVGTPGCGKSTLAKDFNKHVRISQDVLGSRQLCIQEATKALLLGHSVIIDRTNIDVKQRSYWVTMGFDMGINVHCVVLECSPEKCIRRINDRKGHETINDEITLDDKAKIVYNFYRSYKRPELNEGFETITFIKG